MEPKPRPDASQDDAQAAETAAETAGAVMRRRWTRYLPLAAVILGVVLAFASGATKYLSLDEVEAQRQALLAFVHAHPVMAFAAYVAIYVVVVAFSLPGALIMTLTGGFLFGPLVGTAGAVTGASTGATIMFLVARSAFGGVLRRRARGERVRQIEDGIRENAFSYLFVLRLIPAMPFWLVNIAAGLVEIPLRTYWLATVLGIAAPTLIYSSIGSGLGRMFDQGRKPDMRLLFEPQVLLPLIGLALLSIVPVGLHAWRARRRAVSRPGRLG
jgi:uncharacterized membrane protein YdjX (TVP38/TMEM64 family)